MAVRVGAYNPSSLAGLGVREDTSVCMQLPKGLRGEPGLLGNDLVASNQMVDKSKDRENTPSVQAGGASRSGLLEVRMNTGETVVLWVLVTPRGKSARTEREHATKGKQRATEGTTDERRTRDLRERLTQWKGIGRIR